MAGPQVGALTRPPTTRGAGAGPAAAAAPVTALLAGARLLLIAAPAAALEPVSVQAVFRALREIHPAGTTILLVEQNDPLSLRLAQRAYVIEPGAVVFEGSGAALLAGPHVQAAY